MKKKLIISFVATVCMLLFAISAHATSITPLFEYGASNLMSDESYEEFIDINDDDTIVEMGDRFRGIFRIDQLTNNVGGLMNYGIHWTDELTAVFDITVDTKSGNATIGYTWDFKPTPGFATEFSVSTGAMIVMFEDTVNDYNAVGAGLTIPQAEATATGGQMYWALGMEDLYDNDGEGWRAFSMTDDIADLVTTPGAANTGIVNFGLNLLDVGVGPPLLRVTESIFDDLTDYVDWAGNGNFVKPTFNTPYDVKDDLNAAFTPIPEPATLSLLGIGLISLVSFTRRKFKS